MYKTTEIRKEMRGKCTAVFNEKMQFNFATANLIKLVPTSIKLT